MGEPPAALRRGPWPHAGVSSVRDFVAGAPQRLIRHFPGRATTRIPLVAHAIAAIFLPQIPAAGSYDRKIVGRGLQRPGQALFNNSSPQLSVCLSLPIG